MNKSKLFSMIKKMEENEAFLQQQKRFKSET
jgi:hypothetical protein